MSKSKMGRPRKYGADDVDEFEQRAEDYFSRCDAGEEVEHYDKKTGSVVKTRRKIPATVQGLTRALGFADRHALDNYESHDEQFSTVIKKAIARIEESRVAAMLNGDANVIASIFYLKNMDGWRDAEKETGNGSITVVINPKIGVPDGQRIIEAGPLRNTELPGAPRALLEVDATTGAVRMCEPMTSKGGKTP